MIKEGHLIENAICIRETQKAILVTAPDFMGENVWVPKSQIMADSDIFNEVSGREPGNLIVTEWYAQQTGWEK